jgi:hypothetical protein
MARPSVRLDVGEPGQGAWEDQAGDAAGTLFTIDQREPGAVWDQLETITVSTTALRLTAATYTNHDVARVNVQAQAVRYRLDGVNPTTSVGAIAAAASVIELQNVYEIAGFRVIRDDASDSTLSVQYGRRR